MSDGEQTESPADEDTEPDAEPEAELEAEPDAEPATEGGGVFSPYGIASAALALVAIVAITLGVVIWLGHRGDIDERRYLSRVLQTAAEWTGVLINMNTDNVEASLQRLRDETVGQLNVDFDSAIQPYRQVVQRLQSHSVGQVEAVAIESVHHDPVTEQGDRPPPPEPLPRALATRTDTVAVVATSVAENSGATPQTVHWNLRLDVSDVDGQLLISRLGSIR